jgi:chitin synthase
MELVGTLALPAAISFTLYLVVMAILGQPALIPLILLAVILGLPAVLIVMTSRKIVYVCWMLVYLFSLPIWNFVLPTYAYWHFDDFSWGDTRKVEGVKADKKGGHADKHGEFDSSLITMKKWSEYEKERRTKEAADRNMPIPRFLDRNRGSIDVFRDSELVKRNNKNGSAGSTDSDVPLTQKGAVPTDANTEFTAYNTSKPLPPNKANESKRREMKNQHHSDQANGSTLNIYNNNSTLESTTPDIPLNNIERGFASEASFNRPRASYNAGLANPGIEFDDDDQGDENNGINMYHRQTNTKYTSN